MRGSCSGSIGVFIATCTLRCQASAGLTCGSSWANSRTRSIAGLAAGAPAADQHRARAARHQPAQRQKQVVARGCPRLHSRFGRRVKAGEHDLLGPAPGQREPTGQRRARACRDRATPGTSRRGRRPVECRPARSARRAACDRRDEADSSTSGAARPRRRPHGANCSKAACRRAVVVMRMQLAHHHADVGLRLVRAAVRNRQPDGRRIAHAGLRDQQLGVLALADRQRLERQVPQVCRRARSRSRRSCRPDRRSIFPTASSAPWPRWRASCSWPDSAGGTSWLASKLPISRSSIGDLLLQLGRRMDVPGRVLFVRVQEGVQVAAGGEKGHQHLSVRPGLLHVLGLAQRRKDHFGRFAAHGDLAQDHFLRVADLGQRRPARPSA